MFYRPHQYYCPHCRTKYRIAPGYLRFGPAPREHVCGGCGRSITLSSERFDYYMMLSWKLWMVVAILVLAVDGIGKGRTGFLIELIGGTILFGLVIGFFASYLLVLPVKIVYDTVDLLIAGKRPGPSERRRQPRRRIRRTSGRGRVVVKDRKTREAKEAVPAMTTARDESPEETPIHHAPVDGETALKSHVRKEVEGRWAGLCRSGEKTTDFEGLHADEGFMDRAVALIGSAAADREEAERLIGDAFKRISRRERVLTEEDTRSIYYGATTKEIHIDTQYALAFLEGLSRQGTQD